MAAAVRLPFGENAGHTGTLNVLLGAQASTGQLNIPANGSGILSIASGGIVSSSSAYLADSPTSGSTGTATITGSNSAWNISGGLTLGAAGNTGSLNVNASGGVYVTGVTTFGASIPVNISGGAFTTGGLSSTGGYGVINLTADPVRGMALTLNGATGINTYSGAIYGAASIQKSGLSTQILSGQVITTGRATVTAGTLSFNGSGSSLDALATQGGVTNVSAGTLTLTDLNFPLAMSGGTLNVNGTGKVSALLGSSAVDGTGSILNVTSGGQLSSGQLLLACIDLNSSVSMNISSGGLVNAMSVALAAAPVTSATALVTGTGSTLKVSGELSLGNTIGNGQDAMGSLSITSGGSVSAAYCSFQQAAASVIINGGFLSTGYLTSQDTGDGSINLTDPAAGIALTINDPMATDSNTYSGTISGAGSLLKSGASTQILSGTDTFTGSVQVSGGVLELASRNTFSTLTINSGGTIQINGSGNILVVPTLTIITGGTLDLTKDSADLSGSSLATVTLLAKQGFNGGTWTGTGLTSSSAAADTTHLTAVGVIQNNQGGTALYTASNQFEGVTPGASDILAKFTYYGDTNLDGKVDGSDYSRIDAAYQADKSNSTAATGWFNGDFNYDGLVNGSDYTLIDNAFNSQGAILSTQVADPTSQIAASAATASAVPEPASLGLLGLSAISLLSRRRRQVTDACHR